ncbi:MAG TPA: efflux RND transporter permease subunit [Limnochordales bacterium]
MNLARLAVRFPVTTLMLVSMVVVLGFVAFTQLPLDLLPNINYPVAAVFTTYEGAGPREVENLVTRPIENAIATVDRLRTLRSTSRRGQSVVIAEFEWGTDMNFATLQMRERIDLIRRQLPDGVESPLVFKFDPNSAPIMALTMSGQRSPAEVRRLAEEVVAPRLERIDGVGSVNVSGGLVREIHVVADPLRLAAYRVSLDQLVQTLRQENTSQAGGILRSGTQEFLVRTEGEFRSLEEIASLQIPTGSGASVRLGDLAEVKEDFSDVNVINRLNGKPAVGLSIQKEGQANTVLVARRVRQEVERLRRDLGSDVELAVVFDEAEFIERSIRDVLQNAIIGAVLAGLILLFFLQSMRATLVVMISIPVSIIATFVLVYFMGMTLNIISLGGLALGVGMVVDNSIVVLESIFRHRLSGREAAEAAVEGTNEVGLAISASTFTNIVVFLPVLFISGIASQIFRDLALTNSAALLSSLVVAITVAPLLASRLLAGPMPALAVGELGGTPRDPIQRAVWWLQERYGRAIGAALARRGLVVAVAAGSLAGSAALWPRIGREFMPPTDPGAVRVTMQLPTGTRIEETDKVARQLEQLLARIPEVESIYTSVGGFIGQGGRGASSATPEQASIELDLVPKKQRSRSAQDIAEEVRRLGRQFPGVTINARVQQGLRMGGFGGAPLAIRLRSENEELLAQAAERVAQLVREIPGTRDVDTGLSRRRPEITLTLNRERARELGLSLPQVASAVRTALEGTVATQYRVGGTELDLVVRADPAVRLNRQLLEQIPVLSPRAGVVPLKQLVQFTDSTTPRDLTRENQARTVTVTAGLAGRDLGSVVADVRAALARTPLPPQVQVSFGGDVQQMQESFGSLALAMALAIFLVYAVLASQFESLVQPLSIMLSIPLAAVGVLVGLAVTGRTLNVGSVIGCVMLAGIVVNNAIVLVDYTNQLRRQGRPRAEALALAGRTRLRPILMTTSTTVLGMLPMALGLGEGSEMQAPLATVVVFGLSFATLLTLFVVPVAYTLLEDAGAWLAGLVRRRGARVVPTQAPAHTGGR